MLRRLLAPVVLALAFPLFLSAQSQATTGIIRGVVTDPAGTPVAGASVVLHELQTGFQRQLTTNERSDPFRAFDFESGGRQRLHDLLLDLIAGVNRATDGDVSFAGLL